MGLILVDIACSATDVMLGVKVNDRAGDGCQASARAYGLMVHAREHGREVLCSHPSCDTPVMLIMAVRVPVDEPSVPGDTSWKTERLPST